MAGLLTHLVIAFVGFTLFSLAFKSYKYGFSFAFGHLIPDLIDFGIAGIKQGSLNPETIMTSHWFSPLAMLGHTFSNWLVLLLVILVIIAILQAYKKINKPTLKKILLILALFLLGVILHVLILDVFIIETSPWI
jgi:flagellar biosynthesis protein FliQ